MTATDTPDLAALIERVKGLPSFDDITMDATYQAFVTIRKRDLDTLLAGVDRLMGERDETKRERDLDAAEARLARAVEVLDNARDFIGREYSDPALEPEGEWLAKEAHPLYEQIVSVLAADPRAHGSEAQPADNLRRQLQQWVDQTNPTAPSALTLSGRELRVVLDALAELDKLRFLAQAQANELRHGAEHVNMADEWRKRATAAGLALLDAREQERAAIVSWLRSKAKGSPNDDTAWAWTKAADGISAGDHRSRPAPTEDK